MRKFKILIIDDRWEERQTVYKNALSEDFLLDAVEKASSLFDKILQDDIDAYLVDIILSNWIDEKGKPMELLPVLNYIGNQKPVILVSNEYKELLHNDTLTDLINKIIDNGYKVNSFLLWNEFILAAKEGDSNRVKTIQNTIKLNIARHLRITSNEDVKKFDLAVVAALSEELKPFIKHLTTSTAQKEGKIHYTTGVLKTKSGNLKIIALHQEDMGTVDAAILATFLVQQFQVKNIVLIGVCGGRPLRSAIGDIVIPSEIIAYQKGKITDKGIQLDIDIAKSSLNPRMLFANKCEAIIEKIFKQAASLCARKQLTMGSKVPELLFDEMACGENVLNKEGELDQIALKINKPKLCAIDMETYAIFRMNSFFNLNTLIIKSVMDLTSAKSDKYKAYAAFISANFLKQVLVEEILKF